MGNMQAPWSFIHPKGRAKIKSGSSSCDKWRTGPLGFFTAFKPRATMSVFITVQVRRWGSASCSESMNSYPAYKTQCSQIPSTLTSSLSCLSILLQRKSLDIWSITCSTWVNYWYGMNQKMLELALDHCATLPLAPSILRSARKSPEVTTYWLWQSWGSY